MAVRVTCFFFFVPQESSRQPCRRVEAPSLPSAWWPCWCCYSFLLSWSHLHSDDETMEGGCVYGRTASEATTRHVRLCRPLIHMLYTCWALTHMLLCTWWALTHMLLCTWWALTHMLLCMWQVPHPTTAMYVKGPLTHLLLCKWWAPPPTCCRIWRGPHSFTAMYITRLNHLLLCTWRGPSSTCCCLRFGTLTHLLLCTWQNPHPQTAMYATGPSPTCCYVRDGGPHPQTAMYVTGSSSTRCYVGNGGRAQLMLPSCRVPIHLLLRTCRILTTCCNVHVASYFLLHTCRTITHLFVRTCKALIHLLLRTCRALTHLQLCRFGFSLFLLCIWTLIRQQLRTYRAPSHPWPPRILRQTYRPRPLGGWRRRMPVCVTKDLIIQAGQTSHYR